MHARVQHEAEICRRENGDVMFAQLIVDFIASCGFERPFNVVCISGDGRVTVVKYALDGIEKVCDTTAPEPAITSPPLTVMVISSRGEIQSAVIKSGETVQ
jgi:hypothetical protein